VNILLDNPMTQFSFEWILSLNWLCQKWGQVHYVTGGQDLKNDYAFFGFLLASEQDKDWGWRRLQLSDLERRAVTLDTTFQPGKLTDVVVLPTDD
jgi:hypothetical protein